MKTRIAILLVALGAFALPSSAQQAYLIEEPRYEPSPDVQYESYSMGMIMDNPCTAEVDWIDVDYNVNVYQEVWQTAKGTIRYLTDESTGMSGTNHYGYSTYAYGSKQSDVDSGNQIVAQRYYHKVNTPDQFHVVTVVETDPWSMQTYISIESACGNGMPDSAE